MIVTLYGPDSYRRLKKLNKVVEAYVVKQDHPVHERFTLENEGDLGRLESFLGARSMFNPKKLAVVDEPFVLMGVKELKKLFQTYGASKETTVVLNTAKKPPAPFRFLSEPPNQFQEFPAPDGAELKRFIKSEADKLGLDIKDGDVGLIVQSFGKDTWKIVTELEQMSLTKEQNLDTGKLEPQIDYFTALGGLKRGRDVEERVVALEKILSGRRDDPNRVFNSLAYRLNSEAEARMYADYDVAVKAGKLEHEEALLGVALGLRFDLV